MKKIKVLIKNEQRDIKVPVGIRLLIRKCCHAVLDYEKFSGDSEISVYFVDNERIKELNHKHRNKNVPTDVLSFPMGENGEFDINPETNMYILGDVVISLETACKQAFTYQHSLEREIGFLVVHSMLHIMGYDHETSSIDERKMREIEEAILDKLGINRVVSLNNSDLESL